MSLNGENGTQLTMPVMPAGGMGGYGMGGFGGDGWWGILFLIAIMSGGWGGFGGFGGMNGLMGMWPFMFGGFGGNGAGFQGALTRGELCQDMNFQSLENATRGIQQGLCDGFYSVNTSLLNGFHGVDNAVCTLGYQTQQGINSVNTNMMQGFNASNIVALQNQNALQSQISGCCCDLRSGQAQTQNAIERGFCQTNYNDQANTTAIIQNAHSDTDRVLAKLDAMEMARKDETILALREKLSQADLAASQAAQNAYLVNQLRPCPQPAYLTCNPFTGQTYSYGQYGNGCNSGCCGCNG